MPFVIFSGNFLGAQARWAQLGMELVSHVDPFIQATERTFTVVLQAKIVIRYTAQLIFTGAPGASAEDLTTYLLQQRVNKESVPPLFFLLPFSFSSPFIHL